MQRVRFKMLRIKKLDIFVIKSFFTLFVGTFFICLFIFMMQFLWRWVDELVGKGLGMEVMIQFFFYSGITLVPVSLPLAILLASLITFGNFGERYELLAMKAAGISLIKIMRPLIFCITLLALLSFYFQNVVGPMAQLKMNTLLISLKYKSPELDIPEGVFYSELPNYSLKVGKKDRSTGMLYDVLIYNFEDGFENAHIIYADSGSMEMTADKQHLVLHLYSGDLFENLRAQTMNSQNVPYRRETFREKHSIIQFNSDFNMADASLMSNYSNVKNMRMLVQSIDSMTVYGDSIGRQYYEEIANRTFRPVHPLNAEDTVRMAAESPEAYNVDSLYETAPLMEKQRIINAAIGRVSELSSDLEFKSYTMTRTDSEIRMHKLEWHRKITISLSCLLFFFIGAPLGGIIRKGGLGMPVVVSVLLFIIYYLIDTTGFKMARNGEWVVWMGMWTSTAVLAPLGVFLTYKSNNDSVVLNADSYINWFKKIVGIRSVRHLFPKEVIIRDPDYRRLPSDLRLLTQDCLAYAAANRLTKAPNYFRLWTSASRDDAMVAINEKLEALIEEMSNSRSAALIARLNKYPIIPVAAHVRPFHHYALNLAAGILLPVGLFFYFRIWAFRLRLSKDMERIVKNNKQIQHIIENTNLT